MPDAVGEHALDGEVGLPGVGRPEDRHHSTAGRGLPKHGVDHCHPRRLARASHCWSGMCERFARYCGSIGRKDTGLVMGSRIGRRFSHTFAGPLPAVWHAMADTARYNEAAALPLQTITETLQPDGTSSFRGERQDRAVRPAPGRTCPATGCGSAGSSIDTPARERPLRDASTARLRPRPRRRGLPRRHTRPRRSSRAACSVGCCSAVASWAEWRGRFTRLATQADAVRLRQRSHALRPRRRRRYRPARRRLDLVTRQLADSPYAHGLAQRLACARRRGYRGRGRAPPPAGAGAPVERAREAGDPGLPRSHPPGHARAALGPALPALPRRQGVQRRSLDQLPAGAHCGTCNIDYERDFSRNVELTFRPAAAIRPIGDGEFCLLGPMSTPHIWAHVTLEPSEERVVEFTAPARPLPPAHAGGRAGDRRSSMTADRFPTVVIDDAHRISRRPEPARPAWRCATPRPAAAPS